MFLANYQSELQHYLAQAGELLGGSALPVWLDWTLQWKLRQRLRWEARRGLGCEPPVLSIDLSKRGHGLAVGIERCRWETDEGPIRVARIELPCEGSLVGEFWAVRTQDYRRFYRCLRRLARQQEDHEPPILPKVEQQRLWDNTIGFLRFGQEEMQRYSVTPKRGVLLSGEPGNGKTMACRWLAAECARHGLDWKCVTMQTYEDARNSSQVSELFHLDSPGVILFDDFDTALRDRRESGDLLKQSTFLTELDGVEQKTGVVYLFTSNLRADELDPAMCRPGRIDLILPFPRPDASLRRRLIEERWHADIVGGIDVDRAVGDTAGLSFAELEEAKKLLVMRHVETGAWDWPWVRSSLVCRAEDRRPMRPIGFAASAYREESAIAMPLAKRP